MNSLRIPTVQTLMLFAHSIDTDSCFTRAVFDSWIEVEFVNPAATRLLLVTAIQLRDLWNELLSRRLLANSKNHVILMLIVRSKHLRFALMWALFTLISQSKT